MDKPVRIIVIADRSGSMDMVRDDAIGGFNAFLEQQKEQPGEAVFALILFDHEYLVAVADQPLQDVEPLTRKTYVPRGKTALFDAVGRTIGDATISADDYSNTIVAILTDGKENDSKEIKELAVVREIVKTAREESGFAVFFISADVDAFEDGIAMGVAASSIITYAATAEGTRQAYADMSSSVTLARESESSTSS